jgi:transcriptional regulator with GAF, ATPase, and Fis domain
MESLRAKTAPASSGQVSIPSQQPETHDQKIIFTDQFPTLREAEQLQIAEALKRSNGIQTIAAQMLGMTRRALNNRLSRTRQ